MVVANLSHLTLSDDFLINVAPFTYLAYPGTFTTNQFWLDVGCLDESVTQDVLIDGVNESHLIDYSQHTTQAAVEADDRSFYWYQPGQQLFIHLSHALNPDNQSLYFSFGSFFNDSEAILIDGIYCAPLLRSIPKLSQKADLISYPKIALMSGNVEFDNTNGAMNFFMGRDVFGNKLNTFYLPAGQTSYTSADLVAIGAFYAEDYEWTLGRFMVAAQDKRKALQNPLLQNSLPDGTLTPIVYGSIAVAKCLPYSLEGSTGNVTYQIAQELTSVGTIQIYDDSTKTWVNKSTVSTDLTNGRFVLAYADARAGGLTNGGILKCRALNAANKPTRIHATLGDNACYVIVDLICQFLGISYDSDFFDTTEIAAAAVSSGLVGIVFEKQTPLLDAIAKIQNGCLVGLRFEVNTAGKYTIRIDDNSRTSSGYVPWQKIKDNLTLKISSESINLVSSVTVQYSKNYSDSVFANEKSSSATELAVFNRYGVKKNIDIETALTNQTDAAARAAYQMSRQSAVQQILEINLHGQEYYNLRIYDILHIELQPEGSRQYFGTWKCKVISISPDFKGLSNKITALMIAEV